MADLEEICKEEQNSMIQSSCQDKKWGKHIGGKKATGKGKGGICFSRLP